MRKARILHVLALALIASAAGSTAAQASTLPGPAVHNRPSTVSGTFEAAFQGAGGALDTYTASGMTYLSLPMRAGTSPSITALTYGHEIAYQSSSGYLAAYGDNLNLVTTLPMMPGTSPSITTLTSGNFIVAFQANTGYLWTYTYSPTTGGVNTALRMAAGTSPSITALPRGGSYTIAFQAPTGYLWTYSPATGGVNTTLSMAAGTSPSIAALPGNDYDVAYQATTGYPWINYGPGSSAAAIAGASLMSTGTSPSIAAVPGYGFAVAFTTSDSDLQTYCPPDGVLDMGGPAVLGTSPAIAAKIAGGPFEVAYASGLPGSGSAAFSMVGSLGSVDTAVGMATNTGPGLS